MNTGDGDSGDVDNMQEVHSEYYNYNKDSVKIWNVLMVHNRKYCGTALQIIVALLHASLSAAELLVNSNLGCKCFNYHAELLTHRITNYLRFKTHIILINCVLRLSKAFLG